MNISKPLTSNHLLLAIYLLIFQWLVVSCNGANNAKEPIEIYEYQDTVIITPSPTNKNPDELFNGKVHIALGKIQNYEGRDRIEKNLLSQIATYNSAITNGDKQNCAKYLYKDAIVYFRKYYCGFSDEAIIDEFFKGISQSYVELLNKYREYGIEFSVVVPNLTRKIKQGDNIFIVFNTTFNICSESLYTHFLDNEQSLGISHNGGKNWCFVTINEDTPNILRMSNSEEIIDMVMGY